MIYANYAATSPALSEATLAEVRGYLGGVHLNAGRNAAGIEGAAIALRARRAIAALVGVKNPLSVVFTSGATAALNMAINGLVRPGDHVLSTSIEHNAVARPLHALSESGVISLRHIRCEPNGTLDTEKLRRAIRPETRLLVMSHASNVLGTILPVEECCEIAREYGIFTVLDAAQTAGVLPLAMGGFDALAFAGHKGLGALAGTGGLVLSERTAAAMRPFVYGGTGSRSDSLEMPGFLPDKFEAGTQNTLGILSLAASVEEIVRAGVGGIREHERALLERFLRGLESVRKVTPYGTLDWRRSVAVVSLAVRGYDAADAAASLFERAGIVTRSGLHCSPLAHQTAGSFPGGTVRFSFGRATTGAEIDAMLGALDAL